MPKIGRTNILFSGPSADLDRLQSWFASNALAEFGMATNDMAALKIALDEAYEVSSTRESTERFMIEVYDGSVWQYCPVLSLVFPSVSVRMAFHAEADVGTGRFEIISMLAHNLVVLGEIEPAYRLVISVPENGFCELSLLDGSAVGPYSHLPKLMAEEAAAMYGNNADDAAIIMEHAPSIEGGWFFGDGRRCGVFEDMSLRWAVRGDVLITTSERPGMVDMIEGIDWTTGVFTKKSRMQVIELRRHISDLSAALLTSLADWGQLVEASDGNAAIASVDTGSHSVL